MSFVEHFVILQASSWFQTDDPRQRCNFTQAPEGISRCRQRGFYRRLPGDRCQLWHAAYCAWQLELRLSTAFCLPSLPFPLYVLQALCSCAAEAGGRR